MKKTLYIHIGSPKTGTTALQYFLCENQDVLETKGIFYPDPMQLERFTYCRKAKMTGHHSLPMYIQRQFWFHYPEKENVTEQQVMDEINGQISASTAPAVILSTEAFWVVLTDYDRFWHLKEGFRDFNIKIVVYLRRQDNFIQSGYNECVKTSFCRMTPDEFVQDRYLDPKLNYYAYLKQWALVFGWENIIVRPYEKGQLEGGSIYYDFLKTCGIMEYEGLIFSGKDNNPRLSYDALMFQRLMNVWISDHAVGAKLYEHLIAFTEAGDLRATTAFLSCNVLLPTVRREIIDRYRFDNECVAREFLHRSDGVLFYESLPEVEGREEPFRDLPPARIDNILSFIKKREPQFADYLMRVYNQRY